MRPPLIQPMTCFPFRVSMVSHNNCFCQWDKKEAKEVESGKEARENLILQLIKWTKSALCHKQSKINNKQNQKINNNKQAPFSFVKIYSKQACLFGLLFPLSIWFWIKLHEVMEFRGPGTSPELSASQWEKQARKKWSPSRFHSKCTALSSLLHPILPTASAGLDYLTFWLKWWRWQIKSADPSCCNWIRAGLFIRLIYSGDALVPTPNA